MSRATNRDGVIRRGGGRFEPRIERRDVTSSDVSSNSDINPAILGSVRILQSKRRTDDDGITSDVSSPSIKSPIPRIATRSDSKQKSDIKDTGDDKPSQQITNPSNILSFSIKLFDDYPYTTFNKHFNDNLLNYTSSFNVVAIIGSQGCGKSTFASMLAGNEPGDMYGDYIFRPSSRDFVERGASQTLSVNVYISKHRTIIFDCQAINSGHLIEYTARMLKRESKHINKWNAEDEYDNEMQQLLMFLFEVSHTVILCMDWFLDMNIIRKVMKIQLMTQQLRSQRKVNLVVAQLRSKSNDFLPREIEKRTKILKGIFEGSKLDIKGGISMKKLGFPMYQNIDPEINYVVFAEIKPRVRSDQGTVFEDIFGQYTIPFADVIDKFRCAILNLPRKEFNSKNINNSGILTEKDWFQSVCQPIWDKILALDFSNSR